MGKNCLISMLLSTILCQMIHAHRPIFSEKATTAVLITRPDISQVIDREITEDARQVDGVNKMYQSYILVGIKKSC